MNKCVSIIVIFFLTTNIIAQEAKRVVLVEESTGTGCQWCPRGDVYGKNLLKAYPENIAYVAVHAYNASDPMYNEDYADNLVNLGITSSPSALVNRKNILSMDNVNEAENDFAAFVNELPEANIMVNTDYDESNRELDVHISAEMLEHMSGNFKLAAIVIEDGVTGPAPQYNQSNAYSGGNNGPLEYFDELPSPVPSSIMVYNQVGRHLLGAFSGDGNLPTSLIKGEKYNYSFEWTLPQNYDWEYVRVIAVLINDDTNEVVNAGLSVYLGGNENAKPFFHSEARTKAFVGFPYQYDVVSHDPEYENLTITYIEGPSWLSMSNEENGFALLSGIPESTGDFPVTLELTDGIWTVEQNFIISVEVPQETWEQVGEEGFSYSTLSALDIEFDEKGGLFAMAASYDFDLIQVFYFDEEEWVQLGNDISTNVWDAALAVSPEGQAYVLANNQVYTYTDNSWLEFGEVISSGNAGGDPDIAINDKGEIYIAGTLLGGSTAPLFVKKWVDNSWQIVGDGYVNEMIGIWPKIRFDQNDLPMVIYGGGGPYAFYGQAARFDGAEWIDLGDGYFESESYTRWNFDIVECPNGEIYAINVFGEDRKLNLYQLVDDTWLTIQEGIAKGIADFSTSMVADKNNNLYIVYNDFSAGGGITCAKFDGENWSYMGEKGFTNNAEKAKVILDEDDNPFVAYEDIYLGAKMSVKKFVDLSSEVIINAKQKINIEIFPNPTQNHLFFLTDQDFQYCIYSIRGEKISEGQIKGMNSFSNQKILIDVSEYHKGLYLLNVSNGETFSTLKFLVE